MSYLVAFAVALSSAIRPVAVPHGWSQCHRQPLDSGTVATTVLVCEVVR